MKNKEKYINELIALRSIAIIKGKPSHCNKFTCDECDLYNNSISCDELYEEWLDEEHKQYQEEIIILKLWKPQKFDKYYIQQNGYIFDYVNHELEVDRERYNNYPCFPTEQHCTRYYEIQEKLKELKHDFTFADWCNPHILKFTFRLEFKTKTINSIENYTIKKGDYFFKDKNKRDMFLITLGKTNEERFKNAVMYL